MDEKDKIIAGLKQDLASSQAQVDLYTDRAVYWVGISSRNESKCAELQEEIKILKAVGHGQRNGISRCVKKTNTKHLKVV